MKNFIILILLISSFINVSAQKKSSGSFNIMSYNIRYNNPGDSINAWPNRKDWVKALVRYYDTDILCIQEGLSGQVDDILSGSVFEMTGVGRTDGKREGEFTSIYYNLKRFMKKDSGHFWLSDTPEKPSKGWDSAILRICSWVKLYDKERKKEFYVFNTHYDHIGVEARNQSSLLIKEQITKIAGNSPVVLSGDLNVTPEMKAVKTIKSFLNDAKEVSQEPTYGPEGTFNGFNFLAPLKNRIDYIFTSKHFNVIKFGILSDSKDRRYPSDHLPVMARIRVD